MVEQVHQHPPPQKETKARKKKMKKLKNTKKEKRDLQNYADLLVLFNEL